MAIHTVRTPARRAGLHLAAVSAAAVLGVVSAAGPASADPVSGSTGDEPSDVSGSTSVEPGVSGSTSVEPAVSGSTGVAAGEAYVALGDSYSSGTGTRSYIDDGTECLRSTAAFPSLVAAAGGYDLDFRACSGAVVADVQANQLQALSADTDLVTLTIGGNDADFTGVITECALPGWASNCDGAIDTATSFIDGTLGSRLSGLYAQVRAAAPNAEVVVAGYPRLFMGEDCDVLTFISPEEMTRLNATADLLNRTTSSAAASAGFRFVDPTAAFVGHAVCDDPEWLNGLSNPVVESYHPNTLGHAQGYTPLVSAALGSAATATSEVVAEAASRADEYAAQQAPYAAYDRTIAPSTVDVAALQEARSAIDAGTAPAE
ncbi:SGNH/GDSL hydrolase family protein [Nocardioides zeae]|uniref:SGNH/GDSL hydrolase family protein n=1 Tax=Nocardioides imazamoxiresistens TaxID=3231893 RepID=A0ABU3PV10_9ACTN|nr:SGNH/GDSL hydrolase family protein [Nocardioides zeae]MDT9593079.1 SGNH/GDSL hydrolase family protein [Nocardioides zeae]